MTDEHARIEELLSAMQDGAATPEEVALVQRHLATCEQCRTTAAAYAQIDRQVRRYLMATPVPEMASPWRNEPLVVVAPRRRGNLGHWRMTIVGLATIFVLLCAATALTFYQRNAPQEDTLGTQPSSAAVAFAVTPTRESAAALAAPAASSAAASSAAAAGVAVPTAARAAAAPATAAASSAAASSAAASSAAASVPPRPAAAASAAASGSTGGAAASAAPSAAASSAGSARPSAAASAAAASAAPPAATTTTDTSAINPTQLYRLNTATALTICRPACDPQAQSPDLLRRVVTALDRSLPLAPPVPPSVVPIPYVTLRFTLADGQLVDIGYYLQINQLQLPDGHPPVVAPEDFVAALAGVVAPR